MPACSSRDIVSYIYIYRIWNEFSFHTVYMLRVACCIFSSLFLLFIPWKIQIYWVFLPILLQKMRQHRRPMALSISELRRLCLSKSYPALCHKLIYDIAIFHSINGETCDEQENLGHQTLNISTEMTGILCRHSLLCLSQTNHCLSDGFLCDKQSCCWEAK